MRVPTTILVLLLLLSVAAILFFGLTPKDFDRTNGATWVDGGTVLRLRGSGIAYAEIPEIDLGSYSLDLAFSPSTPPARGFSFLVQVHDGRDDAQLVIGQWRSSIIVLNGDDYSYRRRDPRVSFSFEQIDSRPIAMTLSSGPGGTRLYANGVLVADRPEFRLTLPNGGRRSPRLIAGNSVYARHPWSGEIHTLTVRQGETSAEEAAAATPAGGMPRPASVALQAIPPGPDGALTVPRQVSVLHRNVLGTGFGEDIYSWRVLWDLVINVAGFVPFGALFAALLLRSRSRTLLIWLVPAMVAAALSLSIEVSQAWLPSRSSSLPDFLLNTLGTAVGALAVVWWGRWRMDRHHRCASVGTRAQGRNRRGPLVPHRR